MEHRGLRDGGPNSWKRSNVAESWRRNPQDQNDRARNNFSSSEESYERTPYPSRHEGNYRHVTERERVDGAESSRNRYTDSRSWQDRGKDSRPRSSFKEPGRDNRDQYDRSRNSYSRGGESHASGSYSQQQYQNFKEDGYPDSEPPTKIHCGEKSWSRTPKASSPPRFSASQLQARPHHAPPYVASSTSPQYQNPNYTTRSDYRTPDSYHPDQKPKPRNQQPKTRNQLPERHSEQESMGWQKPPNEVDEGSNEEYEDSDEDLFKPPIYVHDFMRTADAKPTKLEVFNKGLLDYILKNGGHEAIETMPIDKSVKLWAKLEHLQNRIKKHKESSKVTPVMYPPWYLVFLSKHRHDLCALSNKFDKTVFERIKEPVSYKLINYIVRQGGHSKIRSMRVHNGIRNSKMLESLQKIIVKQENGGRSVDEVQYPLWYRQYLSEYEPGVKLPALPDHIKCKPGVSYIERPCRPITRDHPLVQHILQNGGHSAIRTMKVGFEVEGWRKLKLLKYRMKSQGDSFRSYPEWYTKFVLPKDSTH